MQNPETPTMYSSSVSVSPCDPCLGGSVRSQTKIPMPERPFFFGSCCQVRSYICSNITSFLPTMATFSYHLTASPYHSRQNLLESRNMGKHTGTQVETSSLLSCFHSTELWHTVQWAIFSWCPPPALTPTISSLLLIYKISQAQIGWTWSKLPIWTVSRMSGSGSLHPLLSAAGESISDNSRTRYQSMIMAEY